MLRGLLHLPKLCSPLDLHERQGRFKRCLTQLMQQICCLKHTGTQGHSS